MPAAAWIWPVFFLGLGHITVQSDYVKNVYFRS
jgi:hypothetical protein